MLGSSVEGGIEAHLSNMPPNMRIKLTACVTLTHGNKRRRAHAAAYPQR